MKTKTFTLVELLVVIGIIILLAGLLLPAVASGLKKADITKCKAQMTTLANAIKQYQATYGRLPIPSTTNGSTAYTEGNALDADQYTWLIKVLQNHDLSTDAKKANTKGIKFLEIVNNTPGEYQDPWEKNFQVFLDTDYDGDVESTKVCGLIGKGSSQNTYYYSVMIYSMGPDGEANATATNDVNEDNVYSVNTKWKSGTVHQITK